MLPRRPLFFRLFSGGRRPWVVLLGGLWLGGLPWLAQPAFAQRADSLPDIGRRFARYGQLMPDEKLFLHLDRPAYVSGETLWFKLYAVDGATNRPLPASTVAYVEVLDGRQKPVLQAKVALLEAVGSGSLVLPATLASGAYTVRAYTSWMQNFGPELYFQSPITIVNPRTSLGLPAPRPAPHYDARFFPEGGDLVQGLTSKIGFKITDNAGQSVAAEGTVLDAAGAIVARFQTLRFGLGSFSLTPARAGTGYTAVVKPAGQPAVTCPLPAVREQGYVLRLVDDNPQRLRLVVQTRGAALADETVFLLGHARQQVLVAAGQPLSDGQAVFTIDKQQLADGISHFTVFNHRRQPVAERLYFRPPAARLPLSAQTDKPQYGPRELVSLPLAAAGPAGPATGPDASLSVAVYQLDSLSAAGGADITSYLWLSADLKGTVENPGYYLSASGPEAAEATDNLLLTQGWSRFRWTDVLANQPPAPAYLPELHGHLVRGRVVNTATGRPAPGITAYLTAPSRRVQLYNAVSRTDGSVQFEVTDFYGPKQLIAQPDTKRDSLYRVELFSPFSAAYAGAPAARLPLSERLAASLLRRHVQAEVQQRYFGEQPIIYAVPRPADSVAFYGRPDEHYRLDDYTRFKVMEEVMREYVPGVLVRSRKDGFHFLVPDRHYRTTSENPLVLLDGMPVFDTNRIMAFDPLKVQQLDVMASRYFLGPVMYGGIVSYTTYQGDLGGFALDSHALLLQYEGLQGQREFYAPRYETAAQKQSRLPDFRNLLYWNPDARPGAPLTFFTSDQVGTYRVVVQGLSRTGLSVSSTFMFEVKAPL